MTFSIEECHLHASRIVYLKQPFELYDQQGLQHMANGYGARTEPCPTSRHIYRRKSVEPYYARPVVTD